MHRSALAKVAKTTVAKRVVANMGARTVVAKRVASLTDVGNLAAKEKMARGQLDSKAKDKGPPKAAGHVEAHAFHINALRTVETKASQKVVLDHCADYRWFQ